MGLPIWREPDDAQLAKAKLASSAPAQAPSLDRVRSARIRRRPSVHGLRGRVRAEIHDRHFAPRFQRAQPLSHYPSSMPRSLRDGIPPIQTLLETADPLPRSVRDRVNTALLRASEPGQIDANHTDGGRLGERHRLIASTNRIVAGLLNHTNNADGLADAERSSTISNTWHSLLTESPQPTHAHLSGRRTVDTLSRSDRLLDVLPTATAQSTHGSSDAMQSAQIRQELGSPDDHTVDRVRSPTPVDEWEIMRSTIAPDTTLPSADSSFLSATVSQSFARSNASVPTTRSTTQSTSASSASFNDNRDEDSASSVDSEDMCPDDDTFLDRSESLAYDMYYKEMETPEGRVRIAEQEVARQREGNRFALQAETAAVDIGLRLIEAAVDRVEALRTDTRSGDRNATVPASNPDLLRLAEISQRERERRQRNPNNTRSIDRLDMSPHDVETSDEPPIPHPVAAPSTIGPTAAAASNTSSAGRSFEMADALLADPASGDQNLGTMRRIVERLASRDDVPEEWWMSMGLNLSRARPRRLRDAGAGESDLDTRLTRTRSGRVERAREHETNRDDRGPRL